MERLSELTQEEQKKYGDRCPNGYEKIKLLGRGGYSVVWLCRDLKSKNEVAIKQFYKSNSQSGHNEAKIYKEFYKPYNG
jgi:dual specificity tyrosine-phosphorylation-regulated kinase 2/3/4